jgi:hypothetical protein
MSEFSLTVEEANPGDIGRHVARIHKELMEMRDLVEGDYIGIEGIKLTGAVLGPGLKSKASKHTIQIDARIRKNAGILLGDEVLISRAVFTPASSVILAPDTELIPPPSASTIEVATSLLQSTPIAVHEGDVLYVRFREYRKGAIPYLVTATNPCGIVSFVESTTLTIGAPMYIE